MTDSIESLLKELAGMPDYAAVLTLSPWPDGGWIASIALIDWEYAVHQELMVAKLAEYHTDELQWTIDGFANPGALTAHRPYPVEALQSLRQMLSEHADTNAGRVPVGDAPR